MHAGRGTIDMKGIKCDFSATGSDLLAGLKEWGQGQNLTFWEYGHVVYQIKGNEAYSDMVANILPVGIPSGVGSERSKLFFLKLVMPHIKLKGMECRAP